MAYKANLFVKIVVVDVPNHCGPGSEKIHRLKALYNPSQRKEIINYEFEEQIELESLPPLKYIIGLPGGMNFEIEAAEIRMDIDGELDLWAQHVLSPEEAEGMKKEIEGYGFEKMDSDRGDLSNTLSEHTRRWRRSMEEKLLENKDKGTSWFRCNPFDLLVRVQGELHELEFSMRQGLDAKEVRREAADIANMAFMVADAYAEGEPHGEQR